MMTIRRFARSAAMAAVVCAAAWAGTARAAEVRIAIVQAQAGDARKYQPLVDYLATKGVTAKFVTAPDYKGITSLFQSGAVDAMFGGSGIAGALMIKELATPVVRPVAADGATSYHAVVIAPKGSPRYGGSGYFDGKRVIFAALASAGEMFFRAAGPSKPAAQLKAASHGAALDALARGQADVAVVKNHVWNKEKAKHAGLELVGEDVGTNPDGTLVASRRLSPATTQQLAAALLALQADPSGAAARATLGITGYVPASEKDFQHTLGLLGRAGVTKDFAFAF